MNPGLKKWHEHYQPLMDSGTLRPGNEPRFMVQDIESTVENAVVLLHGLSDSPYFMQAIANKFYELGFNVLMPLMPGHGINSSEEAEKKMDSLDVKDWFDEVAFAVACARDLGQKVSIGGLSNGGLLGTYHTIVAPQEITGGLFLFSAALDIGDLIENLLRADKFFMVSWVLETAENVQESERGPLVNNDRNPYRYSWIPMNGNVQLSNCIKEIEKYYDRHHKPKYSDIDRPVFAAHSESDKAASIAEIELLLRNHAQSEAKTELFRMKEKFNVPHASVVLAENVYSPTGEPQEGKNIFFDDMIQAMEQFIEKHLR
ncbi:MAG: alpha/beta hydrolase [Hormoscilla sp.]